ncbi:MAG: PDZ domain-containing protein [Terracidiphilus sp.]|jgi:membrane-associated protease RseP (regulator of RpoE activity)
MKHFLRPYRTIRILGPLAVTSVALVGALALAVASPGAHAQGSGIMILFHDPSPLILHSSTSQGYLGVDLADVDQDKAQALKLKEVRGAIITLIDHDAPAGQIGLHVNDVVIQFNGQDVEGAEQLHRMLREIPAGRKVSLEISRDGNIQTLAVQLVDRHVMERDIWNRLGKNEDTFAQSSGGMGILNGSGDPGVPGALRLNVFGSSLNVGALVEPLASQTAEYLGIPSGLMVKQVVRKSEAAAAGFKPHDVILKVGSDAVTDLSSWDRALHANQGKPVQVTILRDRKQMILTLQVDSHHKSGFLQPQVLCASDGCPTVAEIDPDVMQLFSPQNPGAAEAAAQTLRDQAAILSQLQITPLDAEQLRKQIENFQHQFNLQQFTFDPDQAQELQKQMEQFSKEFNGSDLQFTPEQMEDLQKKLDQLQKDLQSPDRQVAPY